MTATVINWMLMYKTRKTGTGNGIRGRRGMGRGWGMLYSGECRQTFRGMPSNILENIAKHSGKCHQIFPTSMVESFSADFLPAIESY